MANATDPSYLIGSPNWPGASEGEAPGSKAAETTDEPTRYATDPDFTKVPGNLR